MKGDSPSARILQSLTKAAFEVSSAAERPRVVVEYDGRTV